MKHGILTWAVTALIAACAAQADAAVVAYWRFEPGALNIDSGPNHYDLDIQGNGVSQGSATPGYTPSNSGSLTLSGSDTAGRVLKTINAVDLSALNKITVEWWANVATNSAAGIIFEQGTDFNSTAGAIIADVIEGPARMDVAQHTVAYYIDRAARPANGTWTHYAMEIDKAQTGNDRLHLYINGVEVGDNTQVASDTPAFGNAVMYFGSRNNSQFFFDGSIDEVRISDTILAPEQFLMYVPEPASAGALVVAGAMSAMTRRRRVGVPNQ